MLYAIQLNILHAQYVELSTSLYFTLSESSFSSKNFSCEFSYEIRHKSLAVTGHHWTWYHFSIVLVSWGKRYFYSSVTFTKGPYGNLNRQGILILILVPRVWKFYFFIITSTSSLQLPAFFFLRKPFTTATKKSIQQPKSQSCGRQNIHC